ncbi:MAG: PEP-CTERM sorting domain-containing protein [Verrucomicrobiia bacterium]
MKRIALTAICAGALVNQVRAVDPVIYGSAYDESESPSTLYNINPNTGAATAIGAIGFNGVSAIDFSSSGILYGVGISPGGVQQLITINPLTGAGTVVGATTLDASSHFQDISFRNSDDALYGYENGDIYTFNITTGVATFLGNADNFPSGNGLAFSPFDTLYKADNNNLSTIDQSTGAATVVEPLNYATFGDRVNGMKFDDSTGVLWASVRAADTSCYLATVDIDLGNVNEIGPTQFGLTGLSIAIATIPEPGTFTLVGMGLVGLLTLRRRKK